MEIRKRMLDREIKKINSMNLQQLIEQQRHRPDPTPPSPTQRHLQRQVEKQIRDAGFTHNV